MNHTECKRGELPKNMVYYETAASVFKDSTITYVDFEQREVETFGKGKP